MRVWQFVQRGGERGLVAAERVERRAAVFDETFELVLRAPTTETVLAVSTRNRVNEGWSRTSWLKTWLVALNRRREVFDDSPRPLLWFSYCAAVPWMNCCRPLRVAGFRVLKSSSMLVTDFVAEAGIVEPSGSAGLLFGPG